MNREFRVKVLRMSIIVLLAIALFYVLLIMEARESAERVQRDIDKEQAREAWALHEYERTRLESQGVVCRPDAC